MAAQKGKGKAEFYFQYACAQVKCGWTRLFRIRLFRIPLLFRTQTHFIGFALVFFFFVSLDLKGNAVVSGSPNAVLMSRRLTI